MNVAIIPARGGSKRIPRKNIRTFCGKPMISWSIEAAKSSDLFDRIIVSSDDPEIRDIALTAGVEVPFKRPDELANDHVGTLPVIRHALNWLMDRGEKIQHACCIYATAPFLDALYLKKGHALLLKNTTTDFVVSATPFDFPILRAIRLDEQNQVSMFWPEHELSRSQDLPPAYHDAGQFYWGRSHAWLTEERIFSASTHAVIIPPHLVQDIDTPEDWLQAELKYMALRKTSDD